MEKRTKQLEQNMPQYDFLLLLLLLFFWLLFHKEHSSHVTETPHYTNDIFTRLYTFQILSPVTIWQTDKCNTYQKTISQNIHFVDTSMCDGRIFCRRPLFHCVCVGTFKGVFKTKRGADEKGQKWNKILYVASEKKMSSVNVGILGRLSFQMEELKGLDFSQSSRDLFVSFLRLPFNGSGQWVELTSAQNSSFCRRRSTQSSASLIMVILNYLI